LLEEDPEGLRRMAEACRVNEMLRALAPRRVISLAQLPEALAGMQASGEVASVRIAVREGDRVSVVQTMQPKWVRPDASYLVTGGTSGFGLEIRWLASQGAGEVILASRSGGQRPETTAAAEALRKQGCRVTVLAVDIADRVAVEQMMAKVRRNSLPLKGMVHSAMVLEDCYLRDLTPRQLDEVLAPKIKGALNLDNATRDLELDFFVLFSSISSIIGNPGQANYSAANAFLDAFAHSLRQTGRKATTVNWGVLSETGVVARNQQVAKLLAHAGIKGFNNRQAVNALGRALAFQVPQVGVFDVDWPVWLEQNPAAAYWPALGKLATAKKALNPKVESLIASLQSLTHEERVAVIEQNIAVVISLVVKIPEKTIQRNQNIMNYGVDSLMALDLARSLKADLGLELGMMELMNGPSVSQLAGLLLEQFEPLFNAQLLEQVDGMSEAELDALLAQEMAPR
jgi:NAD(P)-dependent dehydrogenase (short-subunit alcohol dehydrogenase family)/acyl carrier protein